MPNKLTYKALSDNRRVRVIPWFFDDATQIGDVWPGVWSLALVDKFKRITVGITAENPLSRAALRVFNTCVP